MKAFIFDRYGSADRMRAGDMPDPELREDDILVEVHAAGVNLLDEPLVTTGVRTTVDHLFISIGQDRLPQNDGRSERGRRQMRVVAFAAESHVL
jgi:NADPH:quinone reductase-like Zn-dependent oxidoreductase